MLRSITLATALLLGAACTVHAQTQPTPKPTPIAGAVVQGAPATTPPAVPIVPVDEVKKALAQPEVVLLDVRTPEEYATGHLRNAQNLDFRSPDFASRAALLDPKKTYVLYCASGNRSSKAALLLQGKGFKNVVNAGAFQTLKEAQLPTE